MPELPRFGPLCRITASPVRVAASARVVGIPNACIASPNKYSRSTGPSTALPSPPREKGVRPDPFKWMSRRCPLRSITSAQKQRSAISQLRRETAELVPGIGHGWGTGSFGCHAPVSMTAPGPEVGGLPSSPNSAARAVFSRKTSGAGALEPVHGT